MVAKVKLIHYIFKIVILFTSGGKMKKIQYLRRLILTIIFLVLIVGCAKKKPVVARINNNHEITLAEFKNTFLNINQTGDFKGKSIDDLKNALSGMIDNVVRIEYAYEINLNHDDQLLEDLIKYRQERVVSQLYVEEVVDYVIKESEIRDFYSKLDREVQIRSITFFLPSNNDSTKIQEARNKAEMVLEKIKSGGDFSTLASEYSDDKTSGKNGGLMDYLAWTTTKDPVRDVAFSLNKGEISDIFEVRRSLRIIKVEDIKKVNRQPYYEVRNGIKELLAGINRRSLQERAKLFVDKLIDEANIKWNQGGLDTLWSWTKNIKSLTCQAVIRKLELLKPEQNNIELVHYQNKRFTVKSFKAKLWTYPSNTKIPLHDSTRYQAALEPWIREDILFQFAMKKRLDKRKEVLADLKENMEQAMILLLERKVMAKEIEPTENELLAFYNENKKQKYSKDEKYLKNSKPKSFEEIKNHVRNDFKIKYNKERRIKWIEEKKSKYKIEIFDEVLESVL